MLVTSGQNTVFKKALVRVIMFYRRKEIVSGTEAVLSHICEGNVFYIIYVDETKYQLEINTNEDEWKATYLYPQMKAITLMRWIRKGIDNGKLIQLTT